MVTTVFTDAAKEIRDMVVAVTGGAHGIGRGIALMFGAHGANVWIGDRDAAGAHAVAKEIRAQGGYADYIPFDLGDQQQRCSFLHTIEQRSTRLDVLVNNAATWSDREFWDEQNRTQRSTPSDWDHVFAVNQTGTMFLSRRAAEIMLAKNPEGPRASRGRIIQITSIHDRYPRRFHVEYAMSKHAQRSLVEELAIALGPHGIRVNGIAPGAIVTDRESADRGERAVNPYAPLRWQSGLPEDVARAALFLTCDSLSHYVHGAILDVSGGLHLWNHWCEERPPAGRPAKSAAP